MINPDADLGFATRIGEENPYLFDVFPDTSISGVEAGILAANYLNERFQEYGVQPTDISDVLRSGKGPLNCSGRAALVHAKLTEIPDLYAGIAVLNIEEYYSKHLFNVGYDLRNGEAFIVDNGKQKVGRNWEGTFEVIVDPWATRDSNPEVHGAIFETAMNVIVKLYENPDIDKVREVIKFIEIPFYDGGYTASKRMHLLPEEILSEVDLEAKQILVLRDTDIVVLNPDASDRLADRIAYGSSRSQKAA